MSKYLVAIVAFIVCWIAGYTIYIAIYGFNLVYGGDVAMLVCTFWVISVACAIACFSIIKQEER